MVPLAGSIAVASQPARRVERASARLEMMKAAYRGGLGWR